MNTISKEDLQILKNEIKRCKKHIKDLSNKRTLYLMRGQNEYVETVDLTMEMYKKDLAEYQSLLK